MCRPLLLCALLCGCASTAPTVELPAGPAEILVRVESHETGRVTFTVFHDWSALTDFASSMRDQDVGIAAIELSTTDPRAPWVVPNPAFVEARQCPRVVQ